MLKKSKLFSPHISKYENIFFPSKQKRRFRYCWLDETPLLHYRVALLFGGSQVLSPERRRRPVSKLVTHFHSLYPPSWSSFLLIYLELKVACGC